MLSGEWEERGIVLLLRVEKGVVERRGIVLLLSLKKKRWGRGKQLRGSGKLIEQDRRQELRNTR